jgi:hypothetical protein
MTLGTHRIAQGMTNAMTQVMSMACENNKS